MPFSEELFAALGYQRVDKDKLKYTKENIPMLREILAEIKAYKEKYEQVPEETLKYVIRAEEEDKKRRDELDNLDKMSHLDQADRSKDVVPMETTAKDIKFGATEVAFKPPPCAPGRK